MHALDCVRTMDNSPVARTTSLVPLSLPLCLFIPANRMLCCTRNTYDLDLRLCDAIHVRRVVSIVSKELNNAAVKKYDLEAWFPAY